MANTYLRIASERRLEVGTSHAAEGGRLNDSTLAVLGAATAVMTAQAVAAPRRDDAIDRTFLRLASHGVLEVVATNATVVGGDYNATALGLFAFTACARASRIVGPG
jgi:hypothetical protein